MGGEIAEEEVREQQPVHKGVLTELCWGQGESWPEARERGKMCESHQKPDSQRSSCGKLIFFFSCSL